MPILYVDCFNGVSGDMFIGALLDAGADFNYMEKELKKLKIDDEYKLQVKTIVKNGISSTKFDVLLNESKDHHTHHHDHHDHSDVHHHHHNHDHSHDHHHSHRSYKSIIDMIGQSELDEEVKDMAARIFKKIGEAEGKIHQVSLEKVHFHEVGAVDSIIDIVGASILIHSLQPTRIVSSPIPVGTGHIHIDHGIYPVPAPATLEILKGIPIQKSAIQSELTTPTGAGIIATLVNQFSVLPSLKVDSIGYGAGTKTFPEHPNVLRVIIGEE